MTEWHSYTIQSHLADDTSLLLEGSEKKFLYIGKIDFDIHYYKTQVLLIICKTHCDNIIRTCTKEAREWEKKKNNTKI